ncbi:MAG: hypothetical protein R3E31_11000 [Chloroflexota bacterium]
MNVWQIFTQIGDVTCPEAFTQLLTQEEAPLGDYRQAAIRVSPGRSAAARQQSSRRSGTVKRPDSILQQYEDLLATARALLGMARQADDPTFAAWPIYSRPCAISGAKQKLVPPQTSANGCVCWPQMRVWMRHNRQRPLPPPTPLPLRRYRSRFRHPSPSSSSAASSFSWRSFLFLIPTSVRLETANPYRRPRNQLQRLAIARASRQPQLHTPNLSQGVSALKPRPRQS